MRRYTVFTIFASALGLLLAAPTVSRAQEVVPIGHIAQIDDRAATTWGMSGMEMLQIKRTIANSTPIMRSETLDARTVEILSRTQSPPLTARDIRHISKNGRDLIVVRRFLLAEVMAEDAQAERTTKNALAEKW